MVVQKSPCGGGHESPPPPNSQTEKICFSVFTYIQYTFLYFKNTSV